MNDLGSTAIDVAECDTCHEPVVRPAPGAEGYLEETQCRYCNASVPMFSLDEKESEKDADGPYRRSQGKREGKVLPYDLRSPPAALANERWAKRPTFEKSRQFWLEKKQALTAELPGAEDEFALVWAAAVTANYYHAKGDPLRQRAVLQTALHRVRRMRYRAMLLARLARAAARFDYFDCAERWLGMARRTRIAEIDGDVAVARAYLAHRRGDGEGCLRALRQEEEGEQIVGISGSLGMLLRIEAIEKSGDLGGARRLYLTAIRTYGAVHMRAMSVGYDLANASRKRGAATGFVALGVIAGLLVMVWWCIKQLLHG